MERRRRSVEFEVWTKRGGSELTVKGRERHFWTTSFYWEKRLFVACEFFLCFFYVFYLLCNERWMNIMCFFQTRWICYEYKLFLVDVIYLLLAIWLEFVLFILFMRNECAMNRYHKSLFYFFIFIIVSLLLSFRTFYLGAIF